LNTYKKGIGLKFGRYKYHTELKASYEELVETFFLPKGKHYQSKNLRK